MENINNDFIEFWIEQDLLCSSFKPNTEMTLDRIKELINLRTQISQNKNQYWLYDITNLKVFPKEARDYADIHGQEYLAATAVIVNSHVTKFLFNTFLQLKKPKIPFQAFTNEEKAKEWIKNLKIKNSNT